MIESTQRRLRQAGFFYEHLLDPPHTTTIGSEAFLFYFSAFIQAARSVTWTLKHEETEKWKEWEPRWKAKRTTEEQKLLDITNKLRTDETHRSGATMYVEFEQEALEALEEIRPDSRPHLVITATNAEGTQTTVRVNISYHFKDEQEKHEVTSLCRQYLELLETMVKDFCEDNEIA